MAAAAARAGFRRMFSVSGFTPPHPPAARPVAEPCNNLFVSGNNSLLPVSPSSSSSSSSISLAVKLVQLFEKRSSRTIAINSDMES
ncbi:hypothetical protein ABZP36_002444 [Zizania latifolia]